MCVGFMLPVLDVVTVVTNRRVIQHPINKVALRTSHWLCLYMCVRARARSSSRSRSMCACAQCAFTLTLAERVCVTTCVCACANRHVFTWVCTYLLKPFQFMGLVDHILHVCVCVCMCVCKTVHVCVHA